MQNFKYPKSEKLKGKNDITLLFEKGKWKSSGNLRLILLKNHQDLVLKNTHIGVSVSKRNFKKAVDRNRIKRILRECYRLHKDVFLEAFGAQSLVMIFWASKEMPEKFQTVESEFLKLCQSQKKT